MKPEDIEIDRLLELDADGGMIRFAGQRALLIDAVAMGSLRKGLVSNFGSTAARGVLTQFGFAHGWRLAEAIQASMPSESRDDLSAIGPRLPELQGLFRIHPTNQSPTSILLVESYEAEQHLLHFGRSDTPACWTISGLISGYLSCIKDREIFVLEDRCVGRGDAACHFTPRARDGWSDQSAEELLYFEPAASAQYLDISLHRAVKKLKSTERKLRRRRRALNSHGNVVNAHGTIVQSEAMRKVVDLAHRVAKVDSTVLITGESGAGKERIARLVHDQSKRAAGPFVAINCGAITETLLESELFGHARGAFTGAAEARPGLFEAANHGTLLLDEIGEISPGMQVKLLRVLQEREVRRVGDNETRRVDVRVLAATNRDLVESIAQGRFRQDLYYRIKVVDLHVPPLRERRSDILTLAHLLLAEAGLRMDRKIAGISPAAADQLLRYDWPGNVRELQNAMERAVALAEGPRVEVVDLPEEVRQALPDVRLIEGPVRRLEEISKEYILAALKLNGGHQERTAQQLGIGSATLYRRLKGYGLIPDRVSLGSPAPDERTLGPVAAGPGIDSSVMSSRPQ